MIWSTSPLLTDDFEVTLAFTAKAQEPRPFDNEGFAFWYVYENGTKAHENLSVSHMQNQEAIIAGNWQKQFLADGHDLLQYRSSFDGLGVFFLGGSNPSVSAIAGDGKTAYRLGAGVPASNAVRVDFLSGKEVSAKVRVQPGKAEVSFTGKTIEIKGDFRPGGFIGITVYGGLKEPLNPKTEKGAFYELTKLDVFNHKKGTKGEEAVAVPAAPTKPAAEKEDLLHELSSFKDHRAESDAIKDLTNMVFKLVVETQPMHAQMGRALQSLGSRVSAMERNFAEMRAQIEKKSGHNLKEEFESIKKELSSLVSDTSKDSQERQQHMEKLHSNIVDVHRSAHSPDNIESHLSNLSLSNYRVLDQLTTEHQKMFGVSIAAIAFIVIAGLSLYNKFRCWEKKHIL